MSKFGALFGDSTTRLDLSPQQKDKQIDLFEPMRSKVKFLSFLQNSNSVESQELVEFHTLGSASSVAQAHSEERI